MKNLFFCLFFSILLPGCYTDSILPHGQNVPLFSEAKEVVIAPSHNARSAELALAYAPTDHIGIIANGQATLYSGSAELGGGYYKNFKKRLVTETYGGFGYTRYAISGAIYLPLLGRNYDPFEADITAYRFFVQEDIGIRFTPNTILAISLKAQHWQYPHFWYVAGKYYNSSWYTADTISGNNVASYTLEPAITFRTGGEHTKFMMQIGGSPFIYNDYFPHRTNFIYFRMGVEIRFGGKDE